MKYNIVGAKIMPTTKVIRHANSKEDAGEINLLKIPLTPITLPFTNIKIKAANPISVPPKKDISGVNASQFIVIFNLLFQIWGLLKMYFHYPQMVACFLPSYLLVLKAL